MNEASPWVKVNSSRNQDEPIWSNNVNFETLPGEYEERASDADFIDKSAVLLFLNLLGIVFSLSRRFPLKDTGRKLAHLGRKLRSRQSISEELSRRIEGDQ